MPVRAPRVDDKRVDDDGKREKFSSRILPAYARRSPKVTDALPVLYLHGLSTGDCGPALRDLLVEDASGLSASSIQRLTESWQDGHAQSRKRELRFHRYAYIFVDSVNVKVRLGEDQKLCVLVVIDVREDGHTELLAVEDGYRESEDSWSRCVSRPQAPRDGRAEAVVARCPGRVGSAEERVPGHTRAAQMD